MPQTGRSRESSSLISVTVFSMAWYNSYVTLSRGIPWNIPLVTLYFLGIHSRLKARMYIPYTSRKYCIISMYYQFII